MTAFTRAHCRCVVVQNYGYDQAAQKLKIKSDWLRANIGKLPHQKFGHNQAVFCDCDLRLVQAMHTVLPSEALAVIDRPAPEEGPAPAQPAVPAYAALRPAQGRRRQPAGI
ncbi:hypothetical protein [Streptomyces sp. AD55]|uniref:hypothetical protein n=1 Tax=Streptomyces sp. AD55 TaxID=3242895 RepID=UPI003527E575